MEKERKEEQGQVGGKVNAALSTAEETLHSGRIMSRKNGLSTRIRGRNRHIRS